MMKLTNVETLVELAELKKEQAAKIRKKAYKHYKRGELPLDKTQQALAYADQLEAQANELLAL